jgi:DNA-binding NarL/FixJ family response regulator
VTPARQPVRSGISGSLEDVSVADVMQFIHLGRRTGTLVLSSGTDSAMVGFHGGKLVSARRPGRAKLGDLLVSSGVLTRDELETALAEETQGAGRRSLGQVLLAHGVVEGEALRRVVVEQIERTISEVVAWTRGSFEFVLDDLTPVDDVALHPGDVAPDADLDTQMVLLEAARLLDERRGGVRPAPAGDEATPAATPPTAPPPPAAGAEALAGLVEAALDEAAVAVPELQVVGDDDELAAALAQEAGGRVSAVRRTGLDRAGGDGTGRRAPIVVLDLRAGSGRGVDDLARLRRRRPSASLVALVDPGPQIAAAYEAGAVAALPADPHAIVACLDNILRSRAEVAAWGERRRGARPQGVERLRRVFGDLRSGLLSATVALNLMHIMSESVERAVLFLVKRDALIALGAFGTGAGGRPLAELTRGLRIELAEVNVLTRAVERSEAIAVPFEETALPEAMTRVLARPASGQVVAFPVLGTQRVISVVYTDNGDRPDPIEDIEILELATAQVGMAFENELLRRQIGRS